MTDLRVRLGTVTLPNPVMTASGTSGHGAELSEYGDLSALGAVVVKSLSAFAWDGNPPVRVVPAQAGMVNSIGLTGPGVSEWLHGCLGGLVDAGARTVVSLWGRTVDDYAEAAKLLTENPLPESVVAIEANVSCPNTEDRGRMFAQSPEATSEVVAALVRAGQVPVWAKLTPAVADVTAVASAALRAGAAALTLINTIPAMAVDLRRRSPSLGGVTGGLSGPAIHPVALRCVYECRRSFPDAAIVGVGGVFHAEDALELVMAGADAIQVGTAIFADPRAPWKVLAGIERWCRRNGVTKIADLVGVAQ